MRKFSVNATELILKAMRWCDEDQKYSFTLSLAAARKQHQREQREAALKEQP